MRTDSYTKLMQPRLIVEQNITAFVNRYQIFRTDASGAKADLIAVAQQKRLAFKEKVLFYTDDTRSQLAFSFRAEKVMDIHGRFIVEDANGELVGMFQKDFSKSLINSTWNILDAAGSPLQQVTESSQVLAVLRRFLAFIPIVGDFAELVLMFFKYHFTFRIAADGTEVGTYRKTTLFRDFYTLSMTDAGYNQIDWRVLASTAVALDALQSR